jgi:hypothetical protein
VNVIDDYDHGTLKLTMHRAFKVAPTSASKVIVLSGEAVAHYGQSFFCRTQGASGTALTVNNGSNDGNYVIYDSWHTIGENLKNLCLNVIPYQGFAAASWA